MLVALADFLFPRTADGEYRYGEDKIILVLN